MGEMVVAGRTLCRSLCPAGGFYSILGRFSPVRISFEKSLCTNCGECVHVCPVEEVLAPSLIDGARQIASGDCIRCGACIDSCTPKALIMGIGYK
jgi:ferredoxin-type protein NapH